MEYKEIRKIRAENIRSLCVRKNWYTNGSIEEYKALLDYGFSEKEITVKELAEMAELILEHSATDYDIPSVMFELNEICNTYFVEV